MGSSRVGSNPTRSVLWQQSERVFFLLSVFPTDAHYLSRNSSVGRASDWRSEGPWFNPGFRHYASQNKPQQFVPLLNCRVSPEWLQVAVRHTNTYLLLTIVSKFAHDLDMQSFCTNKQTKLYTYWWILMMQMFAASLHFLKTPAVHAWLFSHFRTWSAMQQNQKWKRKLAINLFIVDRHSKGLAIKFYSWRQRSRQKSKQEGKNVQSKYGGPHHGSG